MHWTLGRESSDSEEVEREGQEREGRGGFCEVTVSDGCIPVNIYIYVGTRELVCDRVRERKRSHDG